MPNVNSLMGTLEQALSRVNEDKVEPWIEHKMGWLDLELQLLEARQRPRELVAVAKPKYEPRSLVNIARAVVDGQLSLNDVQSYLSGGSRPTVPAGGHELAASMADFQAGLTTEVTNRGKGLREQLRDSFMALLESRVSLELSLQNGDTLATTLRQLATAIHQGNTSREAVRARLGAAQTSARRAS